jgi:hypothetical protein
MNDPARRRARVPALAALAALVSLGCPTPLSDTTSSQVTDHTPPTVTISSPVNNSAYTQTVVVQGAQSKPGKLKSLEYTVTGALGQLAAGSVPLSSIGADGSFAFEFSTLSFSGPIAVNVSAKDWNDNEGKGSVTLATPGAAISSFTAAAASKAIQLNWEPIAGASYTVYYTDNGTQPTLSNGHSLTPAAPPYSMPGLANGKLYNFLLKATANSKDYWSTYTLAMPLSQFTLAPMVTGDYRKINLEWNRIEGAGEFIVQRATSPAGPFADYSGIVQGYSFTDAAVADGVWYYYKVRPSVAGAIASTFNAAQTIQIAPGVNQAIASIMTPTAVNKVQVYGGYAFVAAGSSGLLVVDVSAPGSPSIAASVATLNALDIDLDAAGQYAYVANGAGGLVAFDISNPRSPVLAGSATWSGVNATALSVVPGYAYVLDSSGGTSIHAVKIGASPYSLTPTGTFSHASYTFSHFAATITSGLYHFLYIACGSVDTLLEIYVSNPDTMAAYPTTPVYRSYVDGSGATGYYSGRVWVKPQSVSGDRLYVLASAKTMLEPPPAYALQILGKYPNPFTKLGQAVSQGYYADLTVSGSYAYAADGIGLQQIDVGVETAPVMKQQWNTPGSSLGVASNGTTGFIASGSLGFQTIDLSSPASPSLAGSYASANLSSVNVRDNLAYLTVSSASPRLQVVDVSVPASPAARGGASLTGPGGAALSGNYAIVADGASGLRMVDISNPMSPTLAGTGASLSGVALTRVAVKGDYAYAASHPGMQIFDISDPTHPFVAGFIDSDGGGANDIALRGQFAYIADGAYFQANGLKVIDVSNPALPFQVGKWSGGMTIWRVALYGDYAFVADDFPSSGLFTVNINPASSAFLSGYGPVDTSTASCLSTGVEVFGPYAYVSDSSAAGGLSLMNVANPTAPAYQSTLALTGAQDLSLSGRYAYVTDGSALRIVKLF